MTSVSQFFHMTNQQQEVEKIWCSVLVQLAGGKQFTEVILPSGAKTRIGKDGIASLAQRCRYDFQNALETLCTENNVADSTTLTSRSKMMLSLTRFAFMFSLLARSLPTLLPPIPTCLKMQSLHVHPIRSSSTVSTTILPS